MKAKLVTAIVLLMIVSACSNAASIETPTPTEVETLTVPTVGSSATETTSLTELPVGSPTFVESTPVTFVPQPTNVPGCTNSAAFVTDVTIPDNTEIGADTRFVKTWRVMNTGTCIWTTDYSLSYYAGDRMFSPESVPLALTYPENALDISISLKAPNTVGTYKGYFVIKNPAGLIMKIDADSRLWLIINVKNTVAATATFAPSSASVSGTSGVGFATVNCAFILDQARVTDVVNAVNAYRADSDLPAYNVNAQLTLAAQKHANDMACNHLFGHAGSNSSTVVSRVTASGYVASSLSENVYGSYPPLTGAGAVNWWRNDQTDLRHNLNLISSTFIDIGVGYAFFDNFGYFVIVFAAPQ